MWSSASQPDGADPDAYLAARHLVVTPWNERQGVLDCELERQGYSRQVAMKTPRC